MIDSKERNQSNNKNTATTKKYKCAKEKVIFDPVSVVQKFSVFQSSPVSVATSINRDFAEFN